MHCGLMIPNKTSDAHCTMEQNIQKKAVLLGINFAYLIFFESKSTTISQEALPHRLMFMGWVTWGVHLRFAKSQDWAMQLEP